MIKIGKVILISSLVMILLLSVQHKTYAATSGDTDGDGDVDYIDFNNLKRDYNTTSTRADFDGSGLVDIYDYNILVDNFGK